VLRRCGLLLKSSAIVRWMFWPRCAGSPVFLGAGHAAGCASDKAKAHIRIPIRTPKNSLIIPSPQSVRIGHSNQCLLGIIDEIKLQPHIEKPLAARAGTFKCPLFADVAKRPADWCNTGGTTLRLDLFRRIGDIANKVVAGVLSYIENHRGHY
jgi:hypothetical protein